jgi:hypothetical protein
MHSWHCSCSVRILGGGAVCLLTLSHTLPVLLCLLALSRALPAPRLLSRDPWWWRHVPAHPLPHTPSTVFAFALGWDPWWWCLVPAHLLPAPCLLLHLVGKLGGGAACPPLPHLAHSHTLLMQKGWTGERKPTSEGHLPPLECRARNWQDSK